MSSLDLMFMGLKNLWRRKLRTFLTVLGVVIGAASIVIMLSLGIGMSEMWEKEISTMGSLNEITVSKSWRNERNSKMINDELKKEILKIEHVEMVTPVISERITIVTKNNYKVDTSIIGIDLKAFEKFGFEVDEGTLVKRSGKNEVIFGRSLVQRFINPRERNVNDFHSFEEENKEPAVNVLKEKLELAFNVSYEEKNLSRIDRKYKYPVKAVGLIKEGGGEKDWNVYMTIDDLQNIRKQKQKVDKEANEKKTKRLRPEYDSFWVKVDDVKNVKEVENQIKELGVETRALIQFLDEIKKVSRIVQLILGGIGGISLLIAAIGITNTMIMSIFERTKEIGIMKVIGAKISDIRRIFLFEAGVIGITGGLIGLLFSFATSAILNVIAKGFMNGMAVGDEVIKISVVPMWLSLAALIFSTLIGIIAGLYPAVRATKVSALVAIRNE